MKFGKCSICGEYTFLENHRCPPLWQVRIAEDSDYYYGDAEAVGIYARNAEQAAERFAEQWDFDDMLTGETLMVKVAAAVGPDTVQTFTVGCEWIPNYSAWRVEDH